MEKLGHILAVIGVLLAISACGRQAVQNPEASKAEMQQEIAIQVQKQQQYEQQHGAFDPWRLPARFDSIFEYDAFFVAHGERILQAAKDLCAYKMFRMGFVANTQVYAPSIPKKYDGYPVVYGLTPDFPAENVGMQKGDVILAINGTAVRDPHVFASVYVRAFSKNRNKITYYSVSEQQEKTVYVLGTETCQMHIVTIDESVLNASADGVVVRMYPMLFDFLQKDQYMISVVSHEIAHNIMAHNKRGRDNFKYSGIIIENLSQILLLDRFGVDNMWDYEDKQNVSKDLGKIGAKVAKKAFSPVLEAEADYVGLYLMARAGYDVQGAQNTWRRMALSESEDILKASATTSHPPTPARFIALEKTIAEIQQKLKTEKATDLMPVFTNYTLQDIKDRQMAVWGIE